MSIVTIFIVHKKNFITNWFAENWLSFYLRSDFLLSAQLYKKINFAWPNICALYLLSSKPISFPECWKFDELKITRNKKFRNRIKVEGVFDFDSISVDSQLLNQLNLNSAFIFFLF